MLSMPLSLEARWGSLAGTQLSRPVMKIQGNSSLRGCNCVEHTPLEPGTGVSSPVKSQIPISDELVLALITERQSYFGKWHDLCGQLLASPVSSAPAGQRVMTLLGKGLGTLHNYLRRVCWREACVHRLNTVNGSQLEGTHGVQPLGMRSLSHLFAMVDRFSC